MAKKFVRGVTDVDDIESFDKSLTNVNDLISDGQNTYVHTKKGKNESYYKLTDSLKSVISDNSELITVTKDDTTNTATIQPKHDAQKEQSLESTRGTVSIQKGGNGASETTKVDTNPQKVLEHDNLTVSTGLTKEHSGNTTTINVDPKQILFHNYLEGGEGIKVYHLPDWFGSQISLSNDFLLKVDGKQNAIENNISIALNGSCLQQLYALKQTYSVTGGLLKTHVKSVSQNTSVSTPEEEFNFIVKINKGATSASFTLNTHDTTKFTNIMTTYGQDSSVCISGFIFTLSGSNLTVSTQNNVDNNYVITFSDII